MSGKSGGGFLTFLVGVIVGVVASYWYCDKKHQMRADAEIESVKETFAKRYQRENKKPAGETTKVGASWSSLDMAERRTTKTEDRPVYSERERAAVASKDDPSRAENLSPREEERDVHDENDPPFEITADDYLSSRLYEHVQMTWYKKDDTLVIDEYTEDDDGMNDPVIHDQRTIVGDVFEISGFKNNGAMAIYVRNPWTSTDYEITKSLGGYML